MFERQKHNLTKVVGFYGINKILNDFNAIIAGGAVRATFAREFVSDYDIFLRTFDDFTGFNMRLRADDHKSAFETDNTISYVIKDKKFQVIKGFMFADYDPNDNANFAKAIIDNFDFTVCMAAYDYFTGWFELNPLFLEHLAAKSLVYNIQGKYPLASLFRLRKYLKKGYTISGTEIIKLGLKVNNLNMSNYRELKEQLQGIDTAFLQELTVALMTPEYKDKEYDFQHFMEMLNTYMDDVLDGIHE